MKRVAILVGTLGCAAVLAAATPLEQTVQRDVYVSVVGPGSTPVAGLGVGAFHIREDGAERRIVQVGRATDPLDVAIVAYRVGPESPDVRKAIVGVLDTLRRANAHTRVALVISLVTPRFVDISIGAAELQKALDTFFVSPDGLSLFEGIETACRLMQREPHRRRAVLVLGRAAGVGETGQVRRVGQALEAADASLWMLEYRAVLTPPGDRLNPPAEDRQIDRVFSSWTLASGGDQDMVFATTALAGAAARLANLLLSQYVVTYERPADATPKTLRVGVAAPRGTRVLAPTWAPG
jgi:hypothetical protein